jgi:hypothetical protein
VTRQTVAELEAAREAVLAEGQRFAAELEPLLPGSLQAGFERLCLRQLEHVARMDERTRAGLKAAVEAAVMTGVAETLGRLRAPDLWLAPLTAPDLRPPATSGSRLGVPGWIAGLGRGDREPPELGELDEPSNRVWVAISAAAKPLDPVLEEFGFRSEGHRLGGGTFGIAARTLPQLDPSGAIAKRWKRYQAAYGRLAALAAGDA